MSWNVVPGCVLLAAALIVALPALSDLLSLARSVARARRSTCEVGDGRSLIVLIPAHDEELLIAGCLESLRRQSRDGVSLDAYVIADNCTDSTAEIARRAGFTVLERSDPLVRGKPAAIAWALDRVPYRDADAVCIVDADCILDENFAQRLSCVSDIRNVLAQPFIGVSNAEDSPVTALAYLYSRVNNGLAFRLKARAGLNVPVGVGLTLGSDLLKRHGWKAFSLSEDWELYAQLTAAGERIVFEPRAIINAQETRSVSQGRTQRSRWQAGKFQVLRDYLGPVLRSDRTSAPQKIDAVAELIGLGPIGNTLIAMTLTGLALLLPAGPIRTVVVALSMAGPGRLGLYTVLAMYGAKHKRDIVRAFAHLPSYAIRRTAVLTSSIAASPKAWIRATRHPQSL